MASNEPRPLRETLDGFADAGVHEIRRTRLRAALPVALRDALPWLTAGAALFLVLRWAGVLPPSWGLILAWGALLVFLPYLLAVVSDLGLEQSKDIAPGQGLAVIDRQADLQDRLGAAHDLLQRPERTAFMEAAIEDARAYVARAKEEVAPLAVKPRRSQTPLMPWLLLPLALVVLSAFAGTSATPATRTAANPPTVRKPIETASSEPDRSTEELTQPPVPETPPNAKSPAGKPGKPVQQTAAGALDKELRASSGRTQPGAASEAGAPSQATRATSAPSDQGQAAEGKRKKHKKPATKPATDSEAKAKMRETEQVERSGTTTGSTSSRGTSKNPAANTWSSKDSVPDAETDPADDENEVEDDDEESQARGGMQPTLRSRKPPVNRDLGVGFGNRADLDANGRGGPGQRKKSRGTASLILGVPIPDHVRGMPSRGRTKVTQERVQPEFEPAAPQSATTQSVRTHPSGRVPTLDLAPWMEVLVREYFLSLRKTDQKGSP